MSLHDIRPAKRRRRRKSDPVREGEVGAVDVVTVERVIVQGKSGPVERKIYVPFDETATATTSADINSSDINVGTNTFDHYQDHGDADGVNDDAAAPAVPGTSRKVLI
jgi:hypothetical protein